MTDSFAPPGGNPADYSSLTGLLRLYGDKLGQQLEDMLPARVIAYDRATNRATVQPIVQMVTTTGQAVSRAQVPSVPVFQYAGGGFVLSFPLAPGDLGWLKANDRDLSLFLQTLDEATPNTARTHSFQDAVFFPDIMRSWSLSEEDAERVVLQAIDGSARVAIGQGEVAITAATAVTVTAPLVTINGDVLITGALEAQGGVTGAGGIVLETHKHSGVTTGVMNSGGPVP